MFLTTADLAYAAAFSAFVDDYLDAGDTSRIAKYQAGKADFSAYVASLHDASRGVGLAQDQVACITYWLIDGGRVIGAIRIRPQPTSDKLHLDGHIGYDIAPSQRRKGYATAMLSLALVEARKLGLERVVITCLAENIGSSRTIEKCGGRLIEVVMDNKRQQPINRYELDTAPATTG
ncbi:GNAT family N-acetyltransferase [Dyella silvatica]|uniref:GNAT family N-acetyltransferase n=1 Tax=Dyella silvatica TaxID=2992128 RepID=UPI002251EDD0|nr:GNAT family N-acetyltransferase [Dyella silvatica]